MGTGQPLTSQAVKLFRIFRFEILFKCSPFSEIITSYYPYPESPQKPQYRLTRVVVAGIYWALLGLAMYYFSKSSLPPSEGAAAEV